MTDLQQPTEPTGGAAPTSEPAGLTPPDRAAAAQRRLLFAIELTLLGLVLVVAGSGTVQLGVILAAVGFFIALSGL